MIRNPAHMLQAHPLVLFPFFRWFFSGRVISAVGDKFFNIALAWWVVSEGGTDSRLHLGILMAVSLLPIVLFGPLMGTLADRFDRKKCMLTADAIRTVLIGVLIGLLAAQSLRLWMLYPVCFFLSLFMPLFEAAANGSLERLTDIEHVSKAAAINSSVVQLSNVLGAGLGTLCLAALDTIGAFTVNAVSFMLSFLFILRLPELPPALSIDAKPSYGRQLLEGFVYLRNTRPIFWLLLVFALVNFFIAPLFLFIPILVKFDFHADVQWVAIFEGSLALGAVLTAFTLSTVQMRRVYLAIFLAVLMIGLSIVALAFCARPIWLILPLFSCGAGMAMVNASALGLFQRHVPQAVKGRFFALLTTVAYAVMPVSYILQGYLTHKVPVDRALMINGMLVVLLALGIPIIPKVSEAAMQFPHPSTHQRE